jgi:hypothetical protein
MRSWMSEGSGTDFHNGWNLWYGVTDILCTDSVVYKTSCIQHRYKIMHKIDFLKIKEKVEFIPHAVRTNLAIYL